MTILLQLFSMTDENFSCSKLKNSYKILKNKFFLGFFIFQFIFLVFVFIFSKITEFDKMKPFNIPWSIMRFVCLFRMRFIKIYRKRCIFPNLISISCVQNKIQRPISNFSVFFFRERAIDNLWRAYWIVVHYHLDSSKCIIQTHYHKCKSKFVLVVFKFCSLLFVLFDIFSPPNIFVYILLHLQPCVVRVTLLEKRVFAYYN